MDPAVSERPLVPGRGRARSGDQPAGGAASLGIPEAQGSRVLGEVAPRLLVQRSPCWLSDPRHHLRCLNLRGIHQQGRGWELQECAGQKGPPHLTYQGSSLAVTCSSGRESRGQGETLGTHPCATGVKTQAPSQQPPDLVLRPGPLWPSPIGHLDL